MADFGWGSGDVEVSTGNLGRDTDFGGAYGGDGDDRACFNCGETGHNKADCPQPRTFSGECRTCGKEGHMSRDCPEKGPMTCRYCHEEGHMAKECPSKPPMVCNNCQEEGHMAAECKAARKIDRGHLETMPGEVAWEEIVKAAHDRDIDDIKEAIQKYAKAEPSATYHDLETAFRAQSLPIHLIAIEKGLVATLTNMDLQGNLMRKYTVTYRFSDKPPRERDVPLWPSSMEENIERLKNAGEVVPLGIPKCSNCDEVGHTSKRCPQEKMENDSKVEVKCYNCEGIGHRVRDCPEPKKERGTCRNCNQPGHKAADCTEPRDASGVECRKCGETGHFSRDCPQGGGDSRACHNCGQEGHMSRDCTEPRVMKCRNCNGEGHTSRECPEPRNLSMVQCRNCDEMGHMSKDCPKPRDMARVKCSNCQQMGHYKSRCVNPTVEEESGSFFDDGKTGGASGGEDTFKFAPLDGTGDTGSGFGDTPAFGSKSNAQVQDSWGGGTFSTKSPVVDSWGGGGGGGW